MKKVAILTLTLCVFIATNAFSQSMKYGAKGAYTQSNIYVQNDGFYGFKSGFGFGGFFQYDVMDMLGVSIEPMFVQKGARETNYTSFYDEKSPLFVDLSGNPIELEHQKLHLSVIEIPILGQLMFDVGNMNTRYFAGPTFDFIVNSKYERDRNAKDMEINNEETDLNERLKYYDFGLMTGVGYDMEISQFILRIDFTYRYGFTSFNNVEGKPNVFNNNFAVTVGFGLSN